MGKKRRIAIAVEIDEPHPHHQDVFAGIQSFSRKRPDWLCFIDEHPCTEPFDPSHAEPPYDGIIARTSPEMLKRIDGKGIPLVNIHYQTHRPGLASVLPDPVSMGFAAADHLIGLGMPRLTFISDKVHKASRTVCESFTQRAEEEGVPCTVSYFREPPYRNQKGWLEMKANVLRCLDEMVPPVGVFVNTAPLARVVIQLAQANGWHIPRDMAVLCGRDLAQIVEVEPKISTIEVNFRRVGFQAAQLLDELMAGKPIPPEPIMVPPGDITPRESTDYRVVNDDIVAQTLNYISENLDKKMRVESIAYALNISPRLLQQRFAEHLKTGVSQEIRRLRLEKAKRLLTEPDRLIASIPRLVGFASANAMNKAFIRDLGITPSGYRKKILDEKLYSKRSAPADHS